MAGIIRREDIEEVRSRAKIEDIISAHVTLRPSGVGTYKGLCPFHDEKTPSFSVRSHLGLWHCFGCSMGGDVISFVQEINQIPFQEAVEYLADKVGLSLRYEKTAKNDKTKTNLNTRKAIIEINTIASRIYQENLLKPNAVEARKFLAAKGFTKENCQEYSIGYATEKWDEITSTLMHKGYTQDQLLASGIASKSANGKIYDRFRNRAIWPIKDITGQIIGFGARRLDETDKNSPKYLNTPETAAYKKNQVLYGLDIAKKEIVAKKQVVVVEGYTDVMAAHLAGIKNTVATCGTAFGSEHTKLIKRLLGDGITVSSSITMSSGKTYGGEVIFTFDSDEAGQKAALRAFNENQNFVAQTFIALDPQGMDPCDIRLYRGDEQLQEIVKNRIPLVEFVLKSSIKNLDLSTGEGRTQAKEICTPIIAQIKDKTLREEYVRIVSGWIGINISLPRNISFYNKENTQQEQKQIKPTTNTYPNTILIPEKNTLEVLLQLPEYVSQKIFEKLNIECFKVPYYRQIFTTIKNLGGHNLYTQISSTYTDNNISEATKKWVEKIAENVDPELKNTVYELAVNTIPQDKTEHLKKYVTDIISFLINKYLDEQTQILHAKLNRIGTNDPEYNLVFEQIMKLELEKRVLKNNF